MSGNSAEEIIKRIQQRIADGASEDAAIDAAIPEIKLLLSLRRDRPAEVFALRSSGKSFIEIGRQLGISASQASYLAAKYAGPLRELEKIERERLEAQIYGSFRGGVKKSEIMRQYGVSSGRLREIWYRREMKLLPEERWDDVLTLHESGESIEALSEKFSVSVDMIKEALRDATWERAHSRRT